jgi:competence protein ComEA
MKMITRVVLIGAASLALLCGQAADAKKAAPKMEKMATKMADKAAATLDINSASKGELEALKGIGPKYAEAIIKGRPYARKDELVSKKVLPEGVYNSVKELIIAKQAAKK